ncbi:class I SAM-dependent methyltransferase [Amorphoplanes digitatis]|uniref:Ubiquinone/menaquinone biosynthesis C-methylase UbiE n=1 Tax=Actinoplanes digitatis TaxID=1868 RepID=A0A7W7HTW3_9ACTN|nr:class I SAM-dependent methyltransferase [Actinoplanes digitatis]MBB4760723.1 ubiquinone/menaquinone biosynthesis C-methylase UbiE [Actinoplanes digitatis]
MQLALDARAIAKRYCRNADGSPRSCAPYHASWPVLSLLSAVASAGHNESFFVRYIRQTAAAKGPLSIVICALADFEMLRVTLQALGGGRGHHVFILDSCPTPIMVGRHFLRIVAPAGTAVSFGLVRAEEIALRSGSVDLIATDMFLNKVPFADQPAVVSEWHRVLKRGGEVVTTVHLAENGLRIPLRADDAQVDDFSRRVVRQAATQPLLSRVEARLIAEEYAQHNTSYPIVEVDFKNYFHGFATEVVERATFEECLTWASARVVATRA